MKKNTNSSFYWVIILLFLNIAVKAQSVDTVWTLQQCIEYALQKNISIQENVLSNETNKVYANQAKASRYPSLNAFVLQNFAWNKQMDLNNNYGDYKGSNNTSYNLNSSVNLYNGFRTTNSIKQAELSFQAGKCNIEAIRESVSLNVLDAYLQVVYLEEQVKNSEKQVESTTEQLRLSGERLSLGAVSKSDYLQVKSELATENLTLANARNQLAINKVTLMQLMELPVTVNFDVKQPEFEVPVNIGLSSADSIYNIALGIKPQIKNSELNKEIAELDIAIAKAGYQPVLSLNSGLSTGYLSGMNTAYDYQVSNKITPSVGLTLSIPIYQNKKVSSNVAIAKIGTQNAVLNDLSTRNQLRKSIEQACVNVESAIIKYQASLESHLATVESYNVAQEKFNQGLFNSVDFLIQKNNQITSESELLQSKYNLVFSKKILDFYTGISLTL